MKKTKQQYDTEMNLITAMTKKLDGFGQFGRRTSKIPEAEITTRIKSSELSLEELQNILVEVRLALGPDCELANRLDYLLSLLLLQMDIPLAARLFALHTVNEGAKFGIGPEPYRLELVCRHKNTAA